MSWITWFLLESAAALGTVAGLVCFFLLVHWRRGGKARLLLIGLTVSAGLLLLQAVVVTPREHAISILQRIEADVLTGRLDALAAALADTFTAGELDREDFLDLARARLRSIEVRTVRRGALQTTAARDGELTVEVSYVTNVVYGGFTGPVRSRWTMTFVRQAGQWHILSIPPPEVEGQRFTDWRRVE